MAAFRARPLDAGPYPYLSLDALTRRVREGGRTVLMHAVVAIVVNGQGYREVLGVEVVTSEDGPAWTQLLRDLLARGLAGVELVVSDAHPGLKEAVAGVLAGSCRQRCRTHAMRNLLTKVPKSAQPMVATLVRTIFAQPDQGSTWTQHARICEQLAERFPDAADLLAEVGADLLACAAFPREHWRQIWSNNPLQRLNKEIRRRADVVGVFPDLRAPSAWWARSWPSNTTSGPWPANT